MVDLLKCAVLGLLGGVASAGLDLDPWAVVFGYVGMGSLHAGLWPGEKR